MPPLGTLGETIRMLACHWLMKLALRANPKLFTRISIGVAKAHFERMHHAEVAVLEDEDGNTIIHPVREEPPTLHWRGW